MKIKWYGTATLLLESGDSRILIDPYLKMFNPSLPRVPVDEAKTAQAIFITHPHLDHFCDIDAFTDDGRRKVYVSENGLRHAQENGLNTDCMLPLGVNSTYTVGAFTVRTHQSRHCKFDAATVLGVLFSPRTYRRFSDGVTLLKTTKRYKIGDDIYALEISDGEKTAVVLGSAGMERTANYPKGADLLVFPYQGRARMHRYLRKFLDVFRPKAVMIDHFDDAFPPLSHTMNVKKFAPAVEKRLPSARALVPTEGEWYEI